MPIALALMIALVSPAAPSPTTRMAVLDAIDARYARGELDDYTRQLYRVAALKRPDRLPDGLRPLADPRRPAERYISLTPVLLEAWQWLVRNDARGSELHDLLQPPGDYPYVLDSDVLPLRVGYKQASHELIAQVVLDTAEHSWLTEVDDYGFLAPPIERGALRYRIYVDYAGATAAGYCSPYAENEDTSWTDCFSYIVIDPGNSIASVGGIVAHEMSHATQAAMDCEEIRTFWENTSTYIQSQVYPESWDYTLYAVTRFQEQPWQPLDYMNSGASDFYEYGGALLPYYLADTYAAPGEGPALVADIWQASMQDNPEFNEPDYYDAIAEVVSTRGGSTAFEDIFTDFCEARFFLGDWDDGQHITDAWWFYDAEVAIAARYTAASLPIANGHVDERFLPGQFGVAYVLLDLGVYPYPMQVSFQGATATRWRVRVLRVGDDPTLSFSLPVDPTTGLGELNVPASNNRYLVLMAASLGPPTWDPDSSDPRRYLFTYDIKPELPPLAVHSVTPDPVERDRQVLAMNLVGEGFVDGADFSVDFDDPGLQVTVINTVDPTTVRFLLNVDEDTALGPHDVTVTNRDGTQATGIAILTVVEQGDTQDAGVEETPDDGKKGCNCRTGASPGGLLILLLLLGLRRSRQSPKATASARSTCRIRSAGSVPTSRSSWSFHRV